MENVLKHELIRARYMAIDKESLLKEMTDFLFSKGYVNSADDFFKAVWNREKVMSTGIGRGIAVPHGCHDTVKEFVISVWQLIEPIPFEAIDDKPIFLVFMLAVPTEKRSNYMNKLAAISNFIRNPENVKKLNAAENNDALFEQLQGIQFKD